MKSPIILIIVDLFISPFSSIEFCFINIAILLLGGYTFRIATSSWGTDHFLLHNVPNRKRSRSPLYTVTLLI